MPRLSEWNPVVVAIVGEPAIATFKLVKREATIFGNEMQARFARAVGAREGCSGEPDIISRVGVFECRTGRTTKNSKGVRGDRALVDSWCEEHGGAGYLLQIVGEPVPGCISSAEFFKLHGLPAATAGVIFAEYVAERRALLVDSGLGMF